MKKWVMTAGVVGLVVSASVAQSVTSENIVGYNKAQINMGLQIMATQFKVDRDDPNNPGNVYGVDALPDGSKIYVFKDGKYQIATLSEDMFGDKAWDIQPNLGQGVGYWMYAPQSTNVVVSGEVNLADSVTTPIVQGLQLISYPYPVARTINELGITASEYDVIYKYDASTRKYQIATYGEDMFGDKYWDNEFTIGVGEGFWYRAAANSTWVAIRPFTP